MYDAAPVIRLAFDLRSSHSTIHWYRSEFMGHRDLQTTLIYADYVESPHGTAMVDQAFHDLQD
jgi:integrase